MSVHVTPVRTYAATFAALLLLTAATVAVAYVDLGPWNTFTALAIAGAKATLVALVFMHVRGSPRMIPIVGAGGVLWLVILFALTFADYATRPTPIPGP